ncbi:MAG: acyltransferase [Bacteroidetes bacterium]|nr:acyltransferase [Bacteroidota bacterium]
MSNNSGYIKGLDGLRAIAIITVMSFHAEITHFGWLGVQLFFVISGFLITGILWREKQTETSIPFKLKKFWVRRSLRIFPLYFGYLIFISLVYLFFKFPSYYSDYAKYLFTYTFNYSRSLPRWQGNPLFTHLWSLCVEEQFYIFFPLIMFFCPPRFVKYFMLIVIAVSPLTRYLLGEYYTAKGLSQPVVADAVYWNTLSHLDAFFMGGIIPVLSLDKIIKKPQRIFTVALIIAIVAGIINFVYTDSGSYYFNDLGYNHGQTELYEHVWHYTVLNILFASFILSLVSIHSNKVFASIRKGLEAKWMVKIGRVSYGMYLFHWAILVYIFNRFFATDNLLLKTVLFIPYVAGVYFFATLSFRLYESRFLKLKETLFTKKQKPANVNVVPAVSDSSVLKTASHE